MERDLNGSRLIEILLLAILFGIICRDLQIKVIYLLNFEKVFD